MVRAATRTVNLLVPAKLRVLCLHGFRTSGQIMKQQVELANWSTILSDTVEFIWHSIYTMCGPGERIDVLGDKRSSCNANTIGRRIDLKNLTAFGNVDHLRQRRETDADVTGFELYLDGPWPARGKADVENKFSGPYYEWYQTSKDYTEIYGMDESISNICDYISSHGPFDGIMGFSQGAVLAAALIGFHAKGMGPDLKHINFLVAIGGGKSKATVLQPAYFDPIERPSLHMIGEKDFMRDSGELLQKSFKDAVVIRHPWGHVLPRLGAPEEKVLRDFFLKQLDFKLLKSGKVNYKHQQSISPI